MVEASQAVARPLERISAWTAAYAAFAVSHTAYFRLMFGQGSPQKATSVTLQAAARETFQLLFQTVQACVQARELPPLDARELSLDIWSVAHGMAVLAVDGQTTFLGVAREHIPHATQGAVTALLDGLSAKRAEGRRRPR
jgi:hypothetical protein